jgi:hypothetical protein
MDRTTARAHVGGMVTIEVTAEHPLGELSLPAWLDVRLIVEAAETEVVRQQAAEARRLE